MSGVDAIWSWGRMEAVRSVEGLRALLDEGCPWDIHVSQEVVERGDIKLLAFILNEKLPIHPDCLQFAALNGNIEVMQYLLQHAPHSVKFNSDVLCCALAKNHLHCAEFALQNGWPFGVRELTIAAQHQNVIAQVSFLRKWKSACYHSANEVKDILRTVFVKRGDRRLLRLCEYWTQDGVPEENHPDSSTFVRLCGTSGSAFLRKFKEDMRFAPYELAFKNGDRVMLLQLLDTGANVTTRPESLPNMLAWCAQHEWLHEFNELLETIQHRPVEVVQRIQHLALKAACEEGLSASLLYMYHHCGWRALDHTVFGAALQAFSKNPLACYNASAGEIESCIHFCMQHEFPVASELYDDATKATMSIATACSLRMNNTQCSPLYIVNYLHARGCEWTAQHNPLLSLLRFQTLDVVELWYQHEVKNGQLEVDSTICCEAVMQSSPVECITKLQWLVETLEVPLHAGVTVRGAIKDGNVDCLEFLRAYFGWDDQFWCGMPVLQWAVEAGQVDIVEMLLHSGYRPGDFVDTTADILQCAATLPWAISKQVIKLLQQYDQAVFLTQDIVCIALKARQVEFVECLDWCDQHTTLITILNQRSFWENCSMPLHWMYYFQQEHDVRIPQTTLTEASGHHAEEACEGSQVFHYALMHVYFPQLFALYPLRGLQRERYRLTGQTVKWAVRQLDFKMSCEDMAAFMSVTPAEEGEIIIIEQLEDSLRCAVEPEIVALMTAAVDHGYLPIFYAVKDWCSKHDYALGHIENSIDLAKSLIESAAMVDVFHALDCKLMSPCVFCHAASMLSAPTTHAVMMFLMQNYMDQVVRSTQQRDDAVALQTCLKHGLYVSPEMLCEFMKSGAEQCVRCCIENGVRWDASACFTPTSPEQQRCLQLVHEACEHGCPATGGQNRNASLTASALPTIVEDVKQSSNCVFRNWETDTGITSHSQMHCLMQ